MSRAVCRASSGSVQPSLPFAQKGDSPNRIVFGDNLGVLRSLPAESFRLVYIDPPFNTGTQRSYTRLRTEQDPRGDRVGFGGKRYRTVVRGRMGYADVFDDYLGFLAPRLREAHRVLRPDGTLYVHLDYREVHRCRLLLDDIFGAECFLNEIIWAYDFGGRPRDRWPPKHDNILVYVKCPGRHVFNADAVERIPYMAPGLVGRDKARRGKLPTDTWWHTIVPTRGKERTGYPTQKPVGILRRIVAASSLPGDVVVDFFAGSGTTGQAALELGRRFLLVDDNEAALRVMARRFGPRPDIVWEGFDPSPWFEVDAP